METIARTATTRKIANNKEKIKKPTATTKKSKSRMLNLIFSVSSILNFARGTDRAKFPVNSM